MLYVKRLSRLNLKLSTKAGLGAFSLKKLKMVVTEFSSVIS
jgi:hypothetical protein